MKSLGHTVTEIAEALGRSKSTLSRGLRRNATPAYRVYLSHRAHERAVVRKQEAGSRPRLKNEQVVSYVRSKLKQGLSPELIQIRRRFMNKVSKQINYCIDNIERSIVADTPIGTKYSAAQKKKLYREKEKLVNKFPALKRLLDIKAFIPFPSRGLRTLAGLDSFQRHW